MHLWPSLKLRDSFKTTRLKKKFSRTDSSKQNQSNRQKLLGGEEGDESADLKSQSTFSIVCWDVLLILSCCYCCFCCGGCIDHEED